MSEATERQLAKLAELFSRQQKHRVTPTGNVPLKLPQYARQDSNLRPTV